MTDDDSRFAGDGNPARSASPGQVDPLGPVSGEYAYWPSAGEPQAIPVDVAPNPAPKSTAGKSAARAVREIVETLLLALVIFVAVRALVLNFRVDGNSMVPNLHDQEMLLVNRNVYFHFDLNQWLNYLPGEDREGERIVYPFHPPERGDIVVFQPPVTSEKPYIKRVIAVPGDTVEIRQDGYVYINDERLEEPYIQGPITDCNRQRCEQTVVPEGKVYVLGDNRRNSSDSRIFGLVDVDDIIGKAWLTYWPMDNFGLVPHYDYPEISER
ncbi:MAG: signal peptidase [Thermomicrobiales bacterium]|nr:signal peptidase [Thermomicrobiales bacterium]